MKSRLRIGTRGSTLALWQAHWVQAEIQARFPSIQVEIHTIKTTGDRIVDRPLSMVGGKGLFVKEIETALLDKNVDLAVHSMKDMPGLLPDGLVIGAVPARENPFDVLVSNNQCSLTDLPVNAVVGTSSLRRASQLKHLRPDLITRTIRGNLDTRIKKLASGEFDAIVLAAAGLIRLGMADRITQYLDESIMLPAVGQGALCIETRENDMALAPVIQALNHPETHTVVAGERAFLRRLEGSCHIPVACYGTYTENQVTLTGLVASENGDTLLKQSLSSPPNLVEQAGIRLADQLLSSGARHLLENLGNG